jgi:hypothetical protein
MLCVDASMGSDFDREWKVKVDNTCPNWEELRPDLALFFQYPHHPPLTPYHLTPTTPDSLHPQPDFDSDFDPNCSSESDSSDTMSGGNSMQSSPCGSPALHSPNPYSPCTALGGAYASVAPSHYAQVNFMIRLTMDVYQLWGKLGLSEI